MENHQKPIPYRRQIAQRLWDEGLEHFTRRDHDWLKCLLKEKGIGAESERSEVKVAQLCLTLCDPMNYSPWNSPGQNTGVGSLSLLQGIFPTLGLNPGLPHCRQILYQLSHKGKLYSNVTFSMTSFLTIFSKLQSYTHIPCTTFSAFIFLLNTYYYTAEPCHIAVGALTLCMIKNLRITLKLDIHICRSTSMDPTNHGSCSTVLHIY